MARNAKNTRMCSGCMARRDKAELVCVNNFNNNVTIGFAITKKEGRSAYLCPNESCLEKSIKKKAFSRHLKCELPSDFYNNLKTFVTSLIKE